MREKSIVTTLEELLGKAVLLATKAHEGQVDKGGKPYILHPLAVMCRVSSVEEKIVAVLHDVIEDTKITEEDLLNYGFPQVFVDGVVSVTRAEGQSYSELIQQAKENTIGRVVKIADIQENMDLSRIPNPQDADVERVEKRYKKSLKELVESN